MFWWILLLLVIAVFFKSPWFKGHIGEVLVNMGASTFKTAMPENAIYGGGYIRHIKSKTQVLLTDQEVQEAIMQLSEGRLKPSIRTHSRHTEHARSSVAAMSEPAQSARRL